MGIKLKKSYEGYQTLQVKIGEVGAIVGSARVLVVVVGIIFCGVGCNATVEGS